MPTVKRQKFVNLAPSKVLDLNTPCDRATQELQNEYLSFENDLKLWALKDSYNYIKIREISKAVAPGYKSKNLSMWLCQIFLI